ncbi:hypothetical protein SEUCBS140593_001348 [Sporothrix eucalyptigena]|uniref:Cytosine-purine permease n=1 Tax=Sporothrix eucalyptigena TaxID=1812306 RepID=A0ABP0AXG1_9PEZI
MPSSHNGSDDAAVAETEKYANETGDMEKGPSHTAGEIGNVPTARPWWKRLAAFGVETRGVQPVPLEERTDRRGFNIFTFWWTASLTPLAITNGIVGTYYEGLSLEAASLTILFFTLLTALPTALLGTLGPQTGMRQMVQARFAFGLYAIMVVALLNLANTVGWSIIATIIAGETLSAVSGGSLSWDLGIVIISILSLVIAFLGYRIVHVYERWAWIPALIAVVVATGTGGHLLGQQAPAAPATASGVLTYACVVMSFTLTWSTMVSDFAVYVHPSVPKQRVFWFTYLGLVLPTVPLMVLGAAIGGAIPSIPSWTTAFSDGSTGGVLLEMLAPVHGFGKFLAVVIAFSLLGNIAGTMYAITIQFQMLFPPWSTKVPRYLFAVVTTAIIIAAAIPISRRFEESLENFLGLISYWGAIFVAIAGTEFVVFRKRDPSRYDPTAWNDAKKLPVGLAALLSIFLPFGLIVPCMAETWYTGPIAKTTGDIGTEVGFVVCVVVYLVLRTIEVRLTGR